MASLKILLNIALISNGVCEGSIQKCVSPYAYTVVVKGDVCKFMFQQVLIVHCGPNHCRERTVLHLIQRNTNGTNTSDGSKTKFIPTDTSIHDSTKILQSNCKRL